MDFLNSQIGRRWVYDGIFQTENQHVLGAMVPARAVTGYDYEASEETDGSTVCLTEVVPWPFAEDDEGVAFDQGSLYGVRSINWRRPLADGGGDKDWWTAVPRSLPSGYTEVGRCGILVPGVYGDHLAGIEYNTVTWNHRTPTGFLWDTGTLLGSLRATWAPMNLNQRVYPAMISDRYSGQWIDYGPDTIYDSPDTLYVVAALATNHVGFRGGKLTFTKAYESDPWDTGSATYEIIAVRADQFWDPYNADDESMVQVLTSGTVSWSFTDPSDPPVVVEHTLGDMRPSGIGIPFNFFVRYAYVDGSSSLAAVYRSSHSFRLSPRTDVPLFYIATMGNRVAPGGIVIP